METFTGYRRGVQRDTPQAQTGAVVPRPMTVTASGAMTPRIVIRRARRLRSARRPSVRRPAEVVHGNSAPLMDLLPWRTGRGLGPLLRETHLCFSSEAAHVRTAEEGR